MKTFFKCILKVFFYLIIMIPHLISMVYSTDVINSPFIQFYIVLGAIVTSSIVGDIVNKWVNKVLEQ